MENASKALIIAGSFLAGILLLTLFSYLLMQMKDFASKNYSKMNEHEISEFNQKFFQYEGRDNLAIQDVITIINLAKDNNVKANKPLTITVYVNNEDWTNKNTYELYELLEKHLENSYKCSKIEIDTDNTLLVNKVYLDSN